MSIIISGTCGKAKAWKAHLSLEGINVILLNSNPFLLPLRLFYKAIRENVSVFVFRYLNDYSSLFKSALVFVCFVATLVLCRAFNIRVVWLCHNINSETNNHFPRITDIKRRMLLRIASEFAVTSPLLKAHFELFFGKKARFVFPIQSDWDAKNKAGSKELIQNTLDYRDRYLKGTSVRIGLCVTSVADKCAHFVKYREILDTFNKERINVVIVFVGDFTRYNDVDYVASLIKDQRQDLLVFDRKIDFDERTVAASFDFIYRSLSDISFSQSFYNSAFVGVPLLTNDVGLGAEIVRKYKVGYVFSSKDLSSNKVDDFIGSLSCDWSSFLNDHDLSTCLKEFKLWVNNEYYIH